METQPCNKVFIRVEEGNALNFESDVLALKFAQAYYGVDRAVASALIQRGIDVSELQPKRGDFSLVEGAGSIAPSKVLFLGVNDIWNFRYPQVRNFARQVLEVLGNIAPNARSLSLTLHGVGFGLDEIEAFEAEVAGLIDGITSNQFPEKLKQISIVELDLSRAERLKSALTELIPRGYVQVNLQAYLGDLGKTVSDRFRSAGYSTDNKPHIFVAMPFRDDMSDIYHYGIQGAVRAAGFVCERADLSSFTGDVMQWVRSRIQSAKLIIADLTEANPNVYLEVGYAWGCGIPTILLARDSEELRFDVKGQRCIMYSTIKQLEDALTRELRELSKNGTTARPRTPTLFSG